MVLFDFVVNRVLEYFSIFYIFEEKIVVNNVKCGDIILVDVFVIGYFIRGINLKLIYLILVFFGFFGGSVREVNRYLKEKEIN